MESVREASVILEKPMLTGVAQRVRHDDRFGRVQPLGSTGLSATNFCLGKAMNRPNSRRRNVARPASMTVRLGAAPHVTVFPANASAAHRDRRLQRSVRRRLGQCNASCRIALLPVRPARGHVMI